MTLKLKLQHLILGAVLALPTLICANFSQAEDGLTIGSPAPAIDIEHWVSNGNGKFKPITKFEKDKVYVVEFWATWCGPCVASMPHLVELQKRFAGKNVQIISISDEDMETVEGFLKREIKGGAKADDAPKTYGELTSAYCLTTDPDRSCHTAYMEAAGQNGIPCAFIVGKDSRIEYIGHPMEMDEPLSKIADGTWDRAAFAAEFKEQQVISQAMNKIMRLAQRDPNAAVEKIDEVLATINKPELKLQLSLMKLQLLARGGKIDEAVTLADELAANPQAKEFKLQLQMMKVQFLSQAPEDKRLAPAVTELLNDKTLDPQAVNFVAWTIVEKMESGDFKNDELLKLCLSSVEKVVAKMEGQTKAATLDTLAHLQKLNGDSAAAIKTLEEALKLVEDDQLKAQIQDYLEKLKAEKK
jgi:thiol-disulfide isomerase/thioredoxin